jgi:hypothetical protein
MFGRERRSHVRGENQTPKGRREGRGLGPFSSGHLTIIVVVLIVAVAFPFAAFAVTGSNVFVTDATSGAHAKVNTSGQLETHQNGSVTVGGSVIARPQTPDQLFHTHHVTGFSSCALVVSADEPYPSGAGGKAAMVVTEVHITVTGYPGVNWELHRFNNCSDAPLTFASFPGTVGVGGTNLYDQDLEFPSGLAIPTNGKLYLKVGSNGTALADVTTTGYLVASSAVPANA